MKTLAEWCKDNDRERLLSELVCADCQSLPYDSNQSVLWKCENGHRWERSIISRTKFKTDCPMCDPKMKALPVGTKYGCYTIVEKFGEPNKGYKCQCDCGYIHFLPEKMLFEKKHKYCFGKSNYDEVLEELNKGNNIDIQHYECGLKAKQIEKIRQTYTRKKAENYDIDFTGTFHESLEIIECVDNHREELTSFSDKRKKNGGTYTVYRVYRCKCYLCGKEQEVNCSNFFINPPSKYGVHAYDGYYSGASCDCHKISSFQWIVNKVLKEHAVSYRVEESFSDLYGFYGKNKLRYDFAVLNDDGIIKCLIECQGEQHYEPVEEYGGEKQFQNQVRNDQIKRNYAKEHDIPLIEISYKFKKIDDIENFLREKKII